MAAEAIDLSQYRSKEEKIELTPEQEEALKDLASQPEEVLTAFVVWVDLNGNTNAASHLDVPLKPSRPASASEMYGSCAVVMKDIALQHTAQLSGEYATNGVLGGMQAVARQAQSQMAQQAQAAGLIEQINRSKLR